MRPLARRLAPAGLALAAGCSTLASDPSGPQCRTDADCGEGELCDPSQGGVCVLGQPPLLGALALGIDERALDFQVDLLACDGQVGRRGSELVVAERPSLATTLGGTVLEWLVTPGCLCPPPFSCNAQAERCEAVAPSRLVVRQDSRISRDRTRTVQREFAVEDPTGSSPWVVEWPDYQPPLARPPAPVTIDVEPLDPQLRGRLQRLWLGDTELGPALALESSYRCQRSISGVVRTIDGQPLADANVTFRFDAPVASRRAVLAATPIPCGPGASCPARMACHDESGQCGLDVSGVLASSVRTDADGAFVARIYTYCEDVDGDQRALRVTIDFPGTSEGQQGPSLPTTSYAYVQTFIPPGPSGALPIDPLSAGDLCVEPWGGELPRSLELSGAPRVVAVDALGRPWICCSTTCLPNDLPLEQAIPPPAPEACHDFSRVRVETDVAPRPSADWLGAGCQVPLLDDAGGAGRLIRTVRPEDCPAGRCELLIADPDGAPRTFRVVVEHPVGAVFRSQITERISDPADPAGWSVDFAPRVQLRGQVRCASGTLGCTGARASIRAERLVIPDDTAPIVPPYFYEQAAADDGSFSLPVNPGVYVVTALPAPGSPGGPARFSVVDARLDHPGIAFEQGVPVQSLASALVLEEGRPVRVVLPKFATNTSVAPFDIGSWTEQDGFGFDLNRGDTCHGEAARVGCQIRQLRPGSLLASGTTQFTTRDRGPEACP